MRQPFRSPFSYAKSHRQCNVVEINFDSGQLASTLSGAAALVLHSQSNCFLDLTAGDRQALSDFVGAGGLLVLMGDWRRRMATDRLPAGYSCAIDGRTQAGRNAPRADSASWLLSTVFGWEVAQTPSSIRPSVRPPRGAPGGV